jgi:hypothetical protein
MLFRCNCGLVLEIASDNSDLGATLNGFSLNESDCVPLANAIEKVGQAVDSSFMATTNLVSLTRVTFSLESF